MVKGEKMTCKHFKEIAAAVAQIRNKTTRRDVAVALAAVCARSNGRFDFPTFYAACGVAS